MLKKDGKNTTKKDNRRFLDRSIEDLANELLDYIIEKKPKVKKWDSMTKLIGTFWEKNGVVTDEQAYYYDDDPDKVKIFMVEEEAQGLFLTRFLPDFVREDTVDQIADELVTWVKENDDVSVYDFWNIHKIKPHLLPEEFETKIKTATKKAHKSLIGEDVKNKDSGEKELLDLFEQHLIEKGLNNSTINKHLNNIEFFFNPYLKRYSEIRPLEVSGVDIEYYAGNWLIRKVLDTTIPKLMRVLTSFKKFYKIMRDLNKIDDDRYQEIFAECNKSTKYRNRYTSYLAIDFDKDNGPNSWVEWMEGKETLKED